MKNFKKFTAFVLALCMLFSLSVAAFAAEADEHTIYDSAPDEETAVSTEAATSGTIQNSGIRWELDNKGWLTISGSGEAPTFQSADDQPWAAVRDQITEVWFEDVETLTIPDLAYWFEGCVNLTTAELPLAPVIGRHAFYGCSKLSTLTMYYGETILESIGEDAFWREADSGDTLYIAYIIGYPEATVPFYTYDWAASNRSSRYFYDLYGVYQNADAATTALNGIKKAPGISVQSTGSIIGNCPSCGKYSFQGTYVEVAHSSRGHANYNECYLCHYVQYDCLKLPLFLLPCNDTGCLQLRIMGAPNYRELLAKIILKTHYVSPPANRAMYDALYQGVPFVMAADMNLRRIDAAVETARSDGISQIALAALPEQVETVLNRRYRETGKARVFTITDAALRELLGSIAPYAPPDLPFYTSEGGVLDVPPLKAP